MSHNDYILTLSCPDCTGIVYGVSGLLFQAGCNILDAQQFGDEQSGRFFLRVHFDLGQASIDEVRAAFSQLAQRFAMQWQLHDARRRARLLVLVSKQGHCLNDLLFRAHSRQLNIDIAGVASNHPDFAPLATSYGVPFHHLPVSADNREQGDPDAMRFCGAGALSMDDRENYAVLMRVAMLSALQARDTTRNLGFRCARDATPPGTTR